MEPGDGTVAAERGFAADFLEGPPLIRAEDGTARAPPVDLDQYRLEDRPDVEMHSEDSDGVAVVADEAERLGEEPAARGGTLLQDL